MDLKRLNELLIYSPHTGEIRMKASGRLINTDPDGFITVYDAISKRRTKFRVNRLAYALGNGKILRKNQKILHLNLDLTDNRLRNLKAVSGGVFAKVKESSRNLTKELKITPHPTDQYDYFVSYFDNKLLKKEVFHDIIAARQRLIELQLRYAKVLTRYCNFDN